MQISGQPSSPIKVYVVAENRLLRETLVRLFRKRSEIDIVGDTCCSESSVGDIASAKSDLLLLDCFNANSGSDDWLGDLQESIPELKVVLFGMDEDPDLFIQAVRRGIVGYVLKNASATDLLEAVRSVAQGEASCPPRLCKVLFKALASSGSGEKDGRGTTQFLNLSEFTVKNHIYRVMKQVDAQSRHEAVSLIRNID
jgi:DNA-binding NarL/FixJ family response regulator